MPWWGPPRAGLLRLQPWQRRVLARGPRGWAQAAQQLLVLQALLRRSLWGASCVDLGGRVLTLLRMMSRVQQLLRIAGWQSSSSSSEGCRHPPAVRTAWQQWQLHWMDAPQQQQEGLRVLTAHQPLGCLLRLAAAGGQWKVGRQQQQLVDLRRRAGVTVFQRRRRWRVAGICLQKKSAVPHTGLLHTTRVTLCRPAAAGGVFSDRPADVLVV